MILQTTIPQIVRKVNKKIQTMMKERSSLRARRVVDAPSKSWIKFHLKHRDLDPKPSYFPMIATASENSIYGIPPASIKPSLNCKGKSKKKKETKKETKEEQAEAEEKERDDKGESPSVSRKPSAKKRITELEDELTESKKALAEDKKKHEETGEKLDQLSTESNKVKLENEAQSKRHESTIEDLTAENANLLQARTDNANQIAELSATIEKLQYDIENVHRLARTKESQMKRELHCKPFVLRTRL